MACTSRDKRKTDFEYRIRDAVGELLSKKLAKHNVRDEDLPYRKNVNLAEYRRQIVRGEYSDFSVNRLCVIAEDCKVTASREELARCVEEPKRAPTTDWVSVFNPAERAAA